MSSSLYRKYRPTRFAELVGQEHVAKALQNALSQDRLAHAYLFSGTRGTGKTSTARILGQVLNCQLFKDGFPAEATEVEPCGECESCIASRSGSSFDVIELDAASNNGVDDMRELIEKVSYSSAAGGTKVYIIDEVHELTGRASNALLKTLEEPPEHVVFILATTNPEKVLPTIRSRTQHFEFVSLDESQLIQHIKDILSWEEKTLDDETIAYVARKGAGSVRDSLSFLDQVLALGVSSFEEFENIEATTDTSTILELILSVANSDLSESMDKLHLLTSQGKEPRAIVESIISVARDCLVVSLNPQTKVLLSGHNDKDELKNIGDKCGTNFLRNFILQLGKAVADMRGTASLNPLLNVEMALLTSMPSAHVGSTSSGVDTGESAGSAVSERSTSGSKVAPAPRSVVSAEPAETNRSLSSESTSKPTTTPSSVADKNSVGDNAKSKGKVTLGAIKSGSQVSEESSEVIKAPARKITIADIEESWPKVMGLLSAVSQKALSQLHPQKIIGDVLYFEAPADQLEDIKARFKKDASIIRGFIESLHETTFKFQVVPIDSVTQSKQEEKIVEESKEFNPIDHVVEVFGGEVVE